MNAADALTLAHAAGVRVGTDGDDLVLEASAPPPSAVLDLLSRHKAGIVTLLRSPAPEQLPWAAEPTPPQPSLVNLSTQDRAARADARQAALVGGLHVAARGRPPSWADPGALPASGCVCTQRPAVVARVRGTQRLALLDLPSS